MEDQLVSVVDQRWRIGLGGVVDVVQVDIGIGEVAGDRVTQVSIAPVPTTVPREARVGEVGGHEVEIGGISVAGGCKDNAGHLTDVAQHGQSGGLLGRIESGSISKEKISVR